MELDEAIRHAREVAKERNETANLTPTEYGDYINSCRECAAEHEQLAEWLEELAEWRKLRLICANEGVFVYKVKED